VWILNTVFQLDAVMTLNFPVLSWDTNCYVSVNCKKRVSYSGFTVRWSPSVLIYGTDVSEIRWTGAPYRFIDLTAGRRSLCWTWSGRVTNDWRKLYCEELCDLCCSCNICTITAWGKIGWAKHTVGIFISSPCMLLSIFIKTNACTTRVTY